MNEQKEWTEEDELRRRRWSRIMGAPVSRELIREWQAWQAEKEAEA